MHLKSLKIENFRSLKNFEVKRLGHVNLIVGKNNSGKSSVLEALRIYASGASPGTLREIAESHDESCYIRANDDLKDNLELPFENFFSGRKFPLDEETPIVIGDIKRDKFVSLTHELAKITTVIKMIDQEETTLRQLDVVKKMQVLDGDSFDLHTINISRHDGYSRRVPLDSELRVRSNLYSRTFSSLQPASYIPTQFISVDDLAAIWDNVQFSEHGDFIREGLKMISPDIENIAFVISDNEKSNSYNKLSSFQRQAKVKLKNVGKAVSLNSMGDGVSRVLQLLLKSFPAQNGFLLIDEFENGLHYSVQEKVWEHIFNLSKILNIQVFATTHSWDCIESFSKVANSKNGLDGVLFRVGKSVRNSDLGSVIATEFSESQLSDITQSDVEVR